MITIATTPMTPIIPKVNNNPISASTVAPRAIPIKGDVSPAPKLADITAVSLFDIMPPSISPLGMFLFVPFCEILYGEWNNGVLIVFDERNGHHRE